MKIPAPAPAIDPTKFRQATGRFATGITVVTVSEGSEARGMTANSFVSVSLDPPLVLVSIANTANMHGLIKTSGRYGVSVLSVEQLSHSKLFAGSQVPALDLDFQLLAGVPVLENSLSTFACDLHQEIVCGDHTLFVGRVCELEFRNAEPLVYFASAYKELTGSDEMCCH